MRLPEQLRRIVGFDAKGMRSLGLWVLRRRDGVPPGAIEVTYSRAQSTTMMIMLGMMAVETVAVELLLRAMDVSAWVRLPVLVLDVYGLLIGFAVVAACVTRPHVVTAGELRIRYGAFLDVRIPRELITAVRVVRGYNESGLVGVVDDRLTVVVSSQVNMVVELSEPITIVRPLGRRAEVRKVRFFADAPAVAQSALAMDPSGGPRRTTGAASEAGARP
ncbi:hypothetical protein [Nonomuraea glycinis]|uniref:hypothetical protein n=1 Tax=Nonomuraea glycinis TaxID=2047744 RepID=UPI002E153CC3|nr:hypothetical protein OHA68_21830 [Nonomuraea glycinis]